MSSRLLCSWVCFEFYVLLKRSAPLGRHRLFLLFGTRTHDLWTYIVPIHKQWNAPSLYRRTKGFVVFENRALNFQLTGLVYRKTFFIVHFYNKGILYTINLSCNASRSWDMSQLLKAYTYSTPSLGHIEEKLPIKIVINRNTRRRKSWTVSLLII